MMACVPWACGDRQAVSVCLVDGGVQLVEPELRALHVGARGQRAAAGHDLDEVDAALGMRVYRGPDPVDTGRRAAEEVAVPAGSGDRRSSDDDGGQRPVGHGGLPEGEGQVAAVAEVAHRGHSAAGGAPSCADHRHERRRVVAPGEMADWVVARVEGEVHVAVDQPGQDGRPGQVDDVGAVGNRADRSDRVAVDDDGWGWCQGRAGSVEQPRGAQHGEPLAVGHVCHADSLWPSRRLPRRRDYGDPVLISASTAEAAIWSGR